MSPEPQDQPLKELAEAEIKLSTLILDFARYQRRFSRILKSPLGFFRSFEREERSDAAQLKQSVTFMLQGISLAFLIFTASWSLPRVVAGYAATHGGSSLEAYRERLQLLNRTLPADLMKTWREQEELMLALRVLPEPRFRQTLRGSFSNATPSPFRSAQQLSVSVLLSPGWTVFRWCEAVPYLPIAAPWPAGTAARRSAAGPGSRCGGARCLPTPRPP